MQDIPANDGRGFNELKLDDPSTIPTSASGGSQPMVANEQSTSTDRQIYEEVHDDEGTRVESRVEIEGAGDKQVETNLQVNDGQVIFDSRIESSGDSIIINESTNITATSSQSVRVNGREITE